MYANKSISNDPVGNIAQYIQAVCILNVFTSAFCFTHFSKMRTRREMTRQTG